MATAYIGANIGLDFSQPLTVAGSSPGKTVELSIVTDTISRSDALAAVERFRAFLSNCSWPLT